MRYCTAAATAGSAYLPTTRCSPCSKQDTRIPDRLGHCPADTRAKLIEAGVSFIAETVFSHPSKLDLTRSAHDTGHVIALHVMLIPETLAVEGVRRRVRHGGHDVPEAKIRERHRRLWQFAADAIEIADTATIYDNSRVDGPRIVVQLTAGTVIGVPAWPAWASEELIRRWPG